MPFCQISLKTKRPLPKAYPKKLKTLGDHLRKKRLDLKLKQKEVAQILGASPATIYNWENNRASPKVKYIPRIIEFIGYTPYYPSSLILGQKMAIWRQSLGLSRKKLAHYIGIDPSTLRKWEKGKQQPPEKYLKNITQVFTSYPSGA